jgi:hypothetical protein
MDETKPELVATAQLRVGRLNTHAACSQKIAIKDLKTAIIGMCLLPSLLMAQQNDGAWTNIGPSPAAVEAFAVDPHGAGTIFMGTVAGGVRKSVDGGLTWSAVNTGSPIPPCYH